jgi:hypothetical protein
LEVVPSRAERWMIRHWRGLSMRQLPRSTPLSRKPHHPCGCRSVEPIAEEEGDSPRGRDQHRFSSQRTRRSVVRHSKGAASLRDVPTAHCCTMRGSGTHTRRFTCDKALAL